MFRGWKGNIKRKPNPYDIRGREHRMLYGWIDYNRGWTNDVRGMAISYQIGGLTDYFRG